MKTIETKPIHDTTIRVPGSKSYTHRMLVAAALADGVSRIENALVSEDTTCTRQALEAMGIHMEAADGCLQVHGRGGIFAPCRKPLYLGNSGTSMRLLTAIAALGTGTYTLTGTERMTERPIHDLIRAMRQIGIRVRDLNGNGCPPVEVTGDVMAGGHVYMDCRISSQYLSALLLIAPYTKSGIEITVTGGPVSRPYIDMTVETLKRFGVNVFREGYRHFKVRGGQVLQGGDYEVEPDYSQAGYFWGAAAINGTAVKVQGTKRHSCQGDSQFPKVLEVMGCRVIYNPDGVTVKGGPLKGIDVDMGDMPDLVPTLAVIAAFADGTTVIRNVAHLRAKESDRLTAVATELARMGIETRMSETDLTVIGGTPHGATIETYDDHRMAMSFAPAGLRVPGIRILDPSCVEKSFPDFWAVFDQLYDIDR